MIKNSYESEKEQNKKLTNNLKKCLTLFITSLDYLAPHIF